jgi:hypothetical protein
MWVICAASLHSIIVSFNSSRATCSNKFLGRSDTDLVYPVPIIRDELAAMRTLAVDQGMEDENSKGGNLPGIVAAGSSLP